MHCFASLGWTVHAFVAWGAILIQFWSSDSCTSPFLAYAFPEAWPISRCASLHTLSSFYLSLSSTVSTSHLTFAAFLLEASSVFPLQAPDDAEKYDEAYPGLT